MSSSIDHSRSLSSYRPFSMLIIGVSILVAVMIKCHHEDTVNVVIVGEKDQLLVSATIDASPATDLQTSIKPDTGFRAMAMKLVRLKP